RPRRSLGIQQTGDGVDKVLRRHLPAVMKLDPLAQGESPRASISGGFPELSNGRNGLEVDIELDQAVENLPGDSAAIDISHGGRIERSGIIGQCSVVYPPVLYRRSVTISSLHLRRTDRRLHEQIATDPQTNIVHHTP